MRTLDNALLIVALAAACAPAIPEGEGLGEDGPGDGSIGLPDPVDTGPFDADGDGHAAADDCDDADPDVHPGATERCNDRDDDCDGAVDEGALRTFFADADGDGAGDPDAPAEACDAPPGTVSNDRDCDDADPDINPAAEETCDGVDQDCDGAIDEGAAEAFYADADGDGFGDPRVAEAACAPPEGYVADARDCDDTDPAVHPDATEVCDGIDNDCSSVTSEAGMARFEDAAGAVRDVSALLTGAVTWADPGTLTLCRGTFPARLVVQADLTLQAQPGSSTPTLDALGAGAALTLDEGVSVHVEGVALTGGAADDGAGATLAEGATLSSTDTAWTGHTAAAGAPFALGAGATLRLSGGSLSQNTGADGVVSLADDAAFACTQATVDRNAGGAAGAVSVQGEGAQARSLGCDWTGWGANTPATVTTRDAGDATYGDGAWFTCEATGCTDHVTFAGATGAFREVVGVSTAAGVYGCDRTWELSGAPADLLCDACVFGFEVQATPDPARSTSTSCSTDFDPWSAQLAYAASPTAYAAPLLYVWDDTAWVPWAYGGFSGDTLVTTDGLLDDPYTSYGATYYASDYARTALTPE